MPLDLAPIPIVDGHCHSLLRRQPGDDEAFRAHLTESSFPEIGRDHVPHSLLYHVALRELGELFGCEPRPEAIHEARASWGVERVAREIVERASFETWLVDSGYGGEGTFTVDELRKLVPCEVRDVLRLEPLIERLIVESPGFGAFEEAYRAAIADLRGWGYVGMKSIVAYRTGLALQPVDRPTAAAAFADVQETARRDGTLRIASKPLLDYLVVIAVEEAARQEVPIQFHTGLGDPDLDLPLADPARLRLIFADRFRAAQIVLLHTGYPYVRSMAWLAAMYPNVYADIGEAPLFAVGEAAQLFRELLALAPASKLLFSTDASLVPELYWLGARIGRRALATVLDEHVAAGSIDERTALGMAERILRRNAEAVYGL